DHRDLPAGGLELGHLRRLLARKHLGEDILDAELGSDALCGRAVVSGEHDRAHTELRKVSDGFGGGLARRIGDRDQTGSASVNSNVHNSATFARELAGCACESVE